MESAASVRVSLPLAQLVAAGQEVEFLLTARADATQADEAGGTALGFAAQHGCPGSGYRDRRHRG